MSSRYCCSMGQRLRASATRSTRGVGGREMEQIVLADVGGRALAEQPAVAAARRRAHAQRAERGGQRARGARAPGRRSPTRRRAPSRRARGGQRARHARDGERRLAADRDAVGEAEPFEPGAERGVRAVVGIDDDAGDREAGLQDGAHLGQRDAPLLAKPDGRRECPRRHSARHRPSTTWADRGRTPAARSARRRSTRSTRPLGNCRFARARHSTAAARRATACPASGSPCRRSRGCPRGAARRRAAASRRARPPTANA